MIDFNEIKIFLAAAQKLNFTKASQDVALSTPQFTKIIAQLESKLNKKLFNRTTRSVQLTQEGLIFYNEALNLMNSYSKLRDIFNQDINPKNINGKLRIVTANTLAFRRVTSLLNSFHNLYPNVQFDFIISDEYNDLIGENINFAFRITNQFGVRTSRQSESNHVIKKISENPIVFSTTPEFKKKYEIPKSIYDLKKYNLLYIKSHAQKLFKQAKIPLAELTTPCWINTTNGDVLVKIALQHESILVRSIWGIQDELKSGLLELISLDDELDSASDIYLVYPVNKYRSTLEKLFIDYILKSKF